MATKTKTDKPAATKTAAKKNEPHKFDPSKGYAGSGSTYKPPDTDPTKQTVNGGEEAGKEDAN